MVESSSEVALCKSMQLVNAKLTEHRKNSKCDYNQLIIINGIAHTQEVDLINSMIACLNGECSPNDIVECRRLGKPKRGENPILS